jgi:hypothetical protein
MLLLLYLLSKPTCSRQRLSTISSIMLWSTALPQRAAASKRRPSVKSGMCCLLQAVLLVNKCLGVPCQRPPGEHTSRLFNVSPKNLRVSPRASVLDACHGMMISWPPTLTKPTPFMQRSVSSKPIDDSSQLLTPPQGNFLSWHRYFTWTYEHALQTECGYTGTQPYWNWPQYSDNPLRSPIFDGSDTSMSGNGIYSAHPPIYVPLPEIPYITIPPAQGGGCLSSGPFKNFTVHLGPLSPGYANLSTNPQADGLGLNSRCIRRDINPWVSTRGSTDRNVSWLIETHDDILSFQNDMQGDFPNGQLGVHTSGHMTVNGDPGGDFSVSPGDPVSVASIISSALADQKDRYSSFTMR